VKGFVNFVREQGVVGMLVGFAVGLQAATTVNTVVQGFINPIVEWLLSFVLEEPSTLEQLTWTVSDSPEHGLVFYWGLILSGIIRLAAVALIVYGLIRWLRLDRKSK
jgi:large-conductance mechanosensitive channel